MAKMLASTHAGCGEVANVPPDAHTEGLAITGLAASIRMFCPHSG